jgi:tetratricopeptide (TPR) repeat protein
MAKMSIEELRELSSQIDDLYGSGQSEEGRKLLEQAMEHAKESDAAYDLFFQGEWAGYEEKDHEKQRGLIARALAIVSSDFFLLRNMGVALSNLGKMEEAITWFDKALEENPKDWDAMRQRGVSLSKLGKEEEAITWYDKALAENPKDWKAMRNRGVSLSKLDKEEEAITWYDKALAGNPKDWDAMRQRGVSLSKLGKEEKAITWFDKALAENPKDWKAMRERGVSLFKQKQFEESLEWLEKSLTIDDKDEATYYWLAKACYEIGEKDKAWHAIERACELAPKDEYNKQTRAFLAKQFGKAAIRKKPKATEQHQELVALIRRVRDAVDKPNDLLNEMDRNLERYKDFLSGQPAFTADRSIFMVLRKWNSYTPAIPTFSDDDNVGGGYYVLSNGVGTVIDPGYDFIKNFANAGGRFSDIHNIVITHAHNDHTIDFESLLTLAYKYNQDTGPKTLKVFMNLGAYQKFAGLIDLRDMRYLERVHILEPEPKNEHDLGGGLTMRTLPAYHDEIVSDKYAVGLSFEFKRDGKRKLLLLTSDTSLHPWKKGKGEKDKDEVILESPIWKHYQELGKVDVLIPHLGSIKREELEGGLEFIKEPGKVFYKNHLGILGVSMLLANLRPKLALVSEFGAELKSVQRTIINILRDVMRQYWEGSNEKPPKILPADVTLIYDVWNEAIYCVSKRGFVDYGKVDFQRTSKMRHFCYTSERDQQKVTDHIQEQAEAFDQARRSRAIKKLFAKP